MGDTGLAPQAVEDYFAFRIELLESGFNGTITRSIAQSRKEAVGAHAIQDFLVTFRHCASPAIEPTRRCRCRSPSPWPQTAAVHA